jgi:hypothetical protein
MNCKLPLPPPSCRSSFAALSCSCFKVLVIREELLPSKVGDSGVFFRLESHHDEALGFRLFSTELQFQLNWEIENQLS